MHEIGHTTESLKSNTKRRFSFFDPKAFLKDLLWVALMPILLGFFILRYKPLTPLVQLFFWYYGLVYLYATGSALQSKWRTSSPLLTFLMHLFVVFIQVVVLFRIDLCAFLSNKLFSTLRRNPYFSALVGLQHFDHQHVHHDHRFTPNLLDLIVLGLKCIELWILSYNLQSMYQKDPLKRSSKFYKSHYAQILGLILGYALFNYSMLQNNWCRGRRSVLVVVLFCGLYWGAICSLFNPSNTRSSLTMNSVYTPSGFESSETESFNKELDSAVSFQLYNLVRWSLLFAIQMHTFLSSKSSHQVLYRLSFYALYEESIQLVSSFFLCFNYPSESSFAKFNFNFGFYDALIFLSVGIFLHIIEHIIPLVLSLTVGSMIFFLMTYLFLSYLRLYCTQNLLLLDSN